ncbi:MAG: leucine-rich repeat domain-containing protein, partial [Clostridiales bacterium]|nr:leucine-rich repeat domain-containing protein [Clostridiales bacterium]
MAFGGCDLLEKIMVDENNANYASQDGVLYNKAKTEIISAPSALKGTITIPEGVTAIDGYTFAGCKSLTGVIIPSSVTSIGENAFYQCISLTSIIIPDSVRSIGRSAFQYCYALESVTIGSGVTSISSEAFRDCRALTSITFKGTVDQWNAIDKSGGWDSGTYNYVITCTDGTISADGTVSKH